MNRLRALATDLIDDPEKPIRSYTDQAGMEELKRSIAAVGIIEPIIVFEKGERFEVIAGHRRLMAAQQIAMREIPAVVYRSRPEALEAIKLHENVHREDLNPADEAGYFADLLELAGGDTDVLAKQVRQSREYVEGRLNLLRGDPVVMTALAKGEISFAVAQELNKFQQDWYRHDCLKHAIEGGASARLVRAWRSKETAPAASVEPSTDKATSGANAMDTPPATVFQCLYCGSTEEVYQMDLEYIHRPCKRILLTALGRLEKQG